MADDEQLGEEEIHDESEDGGLDSDGGLDTGTALNDQLQLHRQQRPSSRPPTRAARRRGSYWNVVISPGQSSPSTTTYSPTAAVMGDTEGGGGMVMSALSEGVGPGLSTVLQSAGVSHDGSPSPSSPTSPSRKRARLHAADVTSTRYPPPPSSPSHSNPPPSSQQVLVSPVFVPYSPPLSLNASFNSTYMGPTGGLLYEFPGLLNSSGSSGSGSLSSSGASYQHLQTASYWDPNVSMTLPPSSLPLQSLPLPTPRPLIFHTHPSTPGALPPPHSYAGGGLPFQSPSNPFPPTPNPTPNNNNIMYNANIPPSSSDKMPPPSSTSSLSASNFDFRLQPQPQYAPLQYQYNPQQGSLPPPMHMPQYYHHPGMPAPPMQQSRRRAHPLLPPPPQGQQMQAWGLNPSFASRSLLPFGVRKRVSQACSTCRRRKKGCDGVKPTCQTCKASGFVCEWGAVSVGEKLKKSPDRQRKGGEGSRSQPQASASNQDDVD